MTSVLRIREEVAVNGGYTSQSYEQGYQVALMDTETRIPLACLDEMLFRVLVSFYRYWSQENECDFGLWIDGDYIYFDLSECIEEYVIAVDKGKARNQLAIWCHAEKKEIRL